MSLEFIILDDKGKDITDSFFEEDPLVKYQKLKKNFYKFKSRLIDDFEEEERNDVFIYKTLRYPPNSKPPIPD